MKIPNISIEGITQLLAAFAYLVGQVGGIRDVINAAKARGWTETTAILEANADEADAAAIEAGKRARP